MGIGGHRKTLKLGVVYTPALPAFERPRQEGPKFKAISVSKVSVSLAMMSTLWRLRQDSSNERPAWTTQRVPVTEFRTWKMPQAGLPLASDASWSPGFTTEHRAQLNKVLTFPFNFLSS